MEILKIVTIFITSNLLQNIVALKIVESSLSKIPGGYFQHKVDVSDGRISYAACQSNYEPPHLTNCSIFVEKTFKGSDKYKCNVTLNPSGEEVNLERPINRLGEDKVIIFWQPQELLDDPSYSVISVIQLSSCKVANVKIDTGDYLDHMFLVPYVDTFDVFFKNKDVCGDKLCRLTANGHGEIIEGPVGFIKHCEEPFYVKSISKTSSDKGYFYVKMNQKENIHILIRPDGTQQILSRNLGHRGVEVSTIHDAITACEAYADTLEPINCTQYDMTGKFKFQTSLQREKGDTDILFVHNLRDGGFLLGYKAIREYPAFNRAEKYTQYLAKFDAEGKQIGKLISENKRNGQWSSMFENENGDYCVFKFHAQNIVTHECYEDNDFLQ